MNVLHLTYGRLVTDNDLVFFNSFNVLILKIKKNIILIKKYDTLCYKTYTL
jgi:hypothetical protein